MRTNRLKRTILSVLAAFFVVSGVMIGTVDAQGRGFRRHRPARVIIYPRPLWHRHYNPFWDPFHYRTVDPIAYERERGFSEGKDEGEKDAKKGRPENPRGHKDYVKSSSMAFREAFESGYFEGYRDEIGDIREELSKRERGDN